jgi:ABC-type spermidine/putrescine transport system permease subunit I
MQTMRIKNFVENKAGIFYTAVIIIIILFVTDITYLTVAYTSNSFFDTWEEVAVSNVYIDQLTDTVRFVGPVVIVVLNIGLIILLLVSAWKRNSVERPMSDEELLL